ncbi:DUF3362 domain-containing protein [Candidatus Woesearchaeota archaeon]|nr:DUF3362 domain-containing protein [Candidatus Woesearchaeota archaeon]
MSFLPIHLQEGKQHYGLDFSQFDIIFISGDPYYDHPLSGMAILSRLLDAKGYKVGIIAQPETDEEFQVCGKPKYFFCITSGLLDSSVANYTPMLRKREKVLVPEHALMIYTQKVKQLFKGCCTVLGGVEATIRRFTHFDYPENKLRRGILNDTKADILLFSNAERSLLNLLDQFKTGKTDFFAINGAAFRIQKEQINPTIRVLPSFEECVAAKSAFSLLTRIHYLLPDDPFIEPCGAGFIQHNRPAHPLREEEMDYIYGLPFTRKLHPLSKNFQFNQEMVGKLQNSVILGRGCWGSCSFCVIPLVQGKEVAKRSTKSVVKEIETLYATGEKKINDLTLPTLNMYGSRCNLYTIPEQIYSPLIGQNIEVYNKKEYCNQQCVGCKNRVLSDDLFPLLEAVEQLHQKYSGTSLELRSAIRHDIILDQKKLFRKIMQFVTRLKIAPEHIVDSVLKQMNKATGQAFVEFLKEYEMVNKEQGTHKNLVPYFVAAHPGSTVEDMEELKKFCDDQKLFVNLTQVFTPTPGTLSTAAYYTGENTFTKEKVYVARTFHERKQQKNILVAPEERGDENG